MTEPDNLIDRSQIKEPTPSTTRARKKRVPLEALTEPFLSKPEQSVLHEPLTSGGPNYTLESRNLMVELLRLKDNAKAEITAIKADQISIRDRANRDIQTITDRANAEIEGRESRVADLNQSISLICNGLNNNTDSKAPIEEGDPPSEDDNEQ